MSGLLAYQPKRTRFSDILLAIKAQIIARAVVSPSQVQIVATDDRPAVNAEKLVYLRPRRFMGEQPQAEAAGRLDTRLSRQLDVYLSNRVVLDTVNSDEVWLTDANRGYFDLEEDVLNAVHGWTPTDIDGNALTIEDIRILAGAEPDKGRSAIGWGRANVTFEVVYSPPLSLVDISPNTIASATAGTAYSQSFTQVGSESMTVIGTAPAWSITGGALPAGLSVNSGNGALTGTPTTAGMYYFVLTVTDSGPTGSGLSGWHRYALPVALGMAPSSLPGGTQGVPYSQTLTVVGASGTVIWALYPGSGPLPTGLVLSAAGVISGTPTASGTFAFKVRATDARGNIGSQNYSVAIP